MHGTPKRSRPKDGFSQHYEKFYDYEKSTLPTLSGVDAALIHAFSMLLLCKNHAKKMLKTLKSKRLLQPNHLCLSCLQLSTDINIILTDTAL